MGTLSNEPSQIATLRRTIGWIAASSRDRASESSKTSSASSRRSTPPSASSASGPNSSDTTRAPSCPGRYNSWTTTSASNTGTPRAFSNCATVDLPHAKPPVRPTVQGRDRPFVMLPPPMRRARAPSKNPKSEIRNPKSLEPPPQLCRLDRIDRQHCDRQRPDAARNRSDAARLRRHPGEVHVAS